MSTLYTRFLTIPSRSRHTFVSSHHDVTVHLEVLAEQIAQCVILLEQYKVRRVGHAWYTISVSTLSWQSLGILRACSRPGNLPAKGFSVIFFCPSSTRNSSKLCARKCQYECLYVATAS